MTTNDLFEKLRQLANDQHQAELGVVHNAQLAAMRAYNETPGRSTKENWDACREAFHETVERMAKHYLPDQAPAPEGERFKNRKQAFDWLQAQGYKISRGKFYQDCDAGQPPVHQDGTVSRFQVLQYGQQLDVERRSSIDASAMERDQAELKKIKAEADRAAMQAEAMRREHDRDWLPADQAWAAIAALVGDITNSIRHHLGSSIGELIYLAGGDPDRSQELLDGCEQVVAKALNEVCRRDHIEVVFNGD